ncbi:hypothetical protein [Silanimonas algicola]
MAIAQGCHGPGPASLRPSTEARAFPDDRTHRAVRPLLVAFGPAVVAALCFLAADGTD